MAISKSINDWLQEAEEMNYFWAKRAQDNCYTAGSGVVLFDNMYDALKSAFIFKYTPEKTKFWKYVLASLKNEDIKIDYKEIGDKDFAATVFHKYITPDEWVFDDTEEIALNINLIDSLNEDRPFYLVGEVKFCIPLRRIWYAKFPNKTIANLYPHGESQNSIQLRFDGDVNLDFKVSNDIPQDYNLCSISTEKIKNF